MSVIKELNGSYEVLETKYGEAQIKQKKFGLG